MIKQLAATLTILFGLFLGLGYVFYTPTSVKSDSTQSTLSNKVQLIQQNKKLTKQTNITPIKRLTVDESRTIHLKGIINSDTLKIVDKINELSRDSIKPIFLILTSPGGGVLVGAQIVTAIQLSRAPVYTIVYGSCASMCMVIHQFGHKRMAIPRAIMMFHPASGAASGDIDRMVSYLSVVQKFISKFDYQIAKRIGISYREYKRKTAVEWWFDSHDAVKQNVVDELVTIDNAGFEEFDSVQNKNSHLKILKELKW